jgi:hypothetical protein
LLEKSKVTDEVENETERGVISKNIGSLVTKTSKGYESSENNQTSRRKRSTSSSSASHDDLGGVEVLSSKVITIHKK